MKMRAFVEATLCIAVVLFCLTPIYVATVWLAPTIENAIRSKCCNTKDKCTAYGSCYDSLEVIVEKCGSTFEKILKECEVVPVRRLGEFRTICDWSVLTRNCHSSTPKTELTKR